MKKNIYSILKQAKGSLNIRLQQQFSTRATLFPRGHLAMSADVQAGFRKGRGTRDRIANICWIMEKAREFQKNIYFCFINYFKTFDCVNHNKLENSERDGNTRPPDLPPEKSVFR